MVISRCPIWLQYARIFRLWPRAGCGWAGAVCPGVWAAPECRLRAKSRIANKGFKGVMGAPSWKPGQRSYTSSTTAYLRLKVYLRRFETEKVSDRRRPSSQKEKVVVG